MVFYRLSHRKSERKLVVYEQVSEQKVYWILSPAASWVQQSSVGDTDHKIAWENWWNHYKCTWR